jgi:dolichol-phosphate mannosyltransferase
MITLSVIIPARNEESSIGRTVISIWKRLEKINRIKYEILICNDHSTDNTVKTAEKLARKYRNTRVVSNDGKPGFGNVLKFGFTNAKYDFVVPMMADACDDPETLPLMIKKAEEGFDVIVGSRYIEGGKKINVQNQIKSVFSRFAGFICYHVLRINTHDSTNAFKMMRRTAVLSVKSSSNTFDISLELTVKLHKAGFRIAEVPTIWIDRSEGASKFNLVRLTKNYLRWFFSG